MSPSSPRPRRARARRPLFCPHREQALILICLPVSSGVSIFGNDRLIKEGDTVKRTGEIVGASRSFLISRSVSSCPRSASPGSLSYMGSEATRDDGSRQEGPTDCPVVCLLGSPL